MQDLTRKTFLKGLLGASASLAAATSVPAAILPGTEEPATLHNPWQRASFYEIVSDLMNAVAEIQIQSKGAFSPSRDRFTFWLHEKSYAIINGVQFTHPPFMSVAEYIRGMYPRVEICSALRKLDPDLVETGCCYAIKNGHDLVSFFDC